MKPKPWSFSALTNFVTCPKQYYNLRIIKSVPDVMGAAALWGNRVHKAFEDYLVMGAPLDPELAVYQGYLEGIRKTMPDGQMFVEHEMALNRSLAPCDKFAADVFVRGICDVLHVDGAQALALDHKTGKRKQNSRQMKLMAIMVFAHFPEVQSIKVGFFWLKTAEKDTETFVRGDIPALWNEFLPDLKQYRDAFLTDTWQPRQSGLCFGWCPVTSCEFWKPKRVVSGGE